MNKIDLNYLITRELNNWCKRNKILKYFYLIPIIIAFFTFKAYLTKPYFQIHDITKPINLGIHELGHVIFGGFPEIIVAAGGTIAQLTAPLIAIIVFIYQREIFGIFFAFGWLSTNLFDISIYMNDAKDMRLPLVSLGTAEAKHDWNFIFSKLHILNKCHDIAFFVKFLAILSMVIFIIGGSLLIIYCIYNDIKSLINK